MTEDECEHDLFEVERDETYVYLACTKCDVAMMEFIRG